MTDRADLDQKLDDLRRRWEAITDVPDEPLSTIQVVEYSLGTQKKAEVYVNRLLGYLLDPDAPHGMGKACLEAFLASLPDECAFDEPVHDASNVEVAEQVRVAYGDEVESDRYGEVDLAVQVPGEWFLLVELKFSAGENNLDGEGLSQTEFYHEASRLDVRPEETYVADGEYLYIHPADESPARSEHFANWTWPDLTETFLEEFLIDHGPRFPQRTVTQIRELRDDIREITGMSERQQNEDEKIDLYLEHYDAIRDVSETFDEHWQRFIDEWPKRLRQSLEETGDSLDGWHLQPRGDWGYIFKHGWWRRTDDLEPITDRATDVGDARIGWVHRLERNREDAVGARALKLQFRNCGSNDRVFQDAFHDRAADDRQQIDARLPTAAEWTGNKRKMITATYDIELERHGDIFEAYIAALERALHELAWDNEALSEQLTRLQEAAVTEVYGSSNR
jgi:hypothetical protein